MSLKSHWRILIGATIMLILAAFLVPGRLPPPDLNENRVLAEAPKPPRGLKDLGAYRTGLDAYVADHFPARAQLISLINYLRIPLQVTGSKRVIVGRDGWLFYNDDTLLGGARGDPRLEGDRVQAWLGGFAARTETLRAQGVPYLLVIAPNKETIYPDYGPSWYRGPSNDRTSLRLTRLSQASGAGEVLHLYEPMKAARAAGVKAYSRHDTHWTGEGAYAGYVALMTRLKAMGVTQEAPRPRSNFAAMTEGPADRDLAKMLGVGKMVAVDYPRVTVPPGDPPIRITYLTANETWTGPRVVETGQVGKPTALLTVDSFSNALLPFLYGHFSRLVIAHNQDGYWRTDLMARFKPDVVILEVIESGVQHVMSPAPPVSEAASGRILAALRRLEPDIAPIPQSTLAEPTAEAVAPFQAARLVKGCNPETTEIIAGPAGPTLKAAGWISDLGKQEPRGEGALRLIGPDGERLAQIRISNPRPDVADHFSVPTASRSGYDVELPIGDLPAGIYVATVYLKVGSEWTYCAIQPKVIVK